MIFHCLNFQKHLISRHCFYLLPCMEIHSTQKISRTSKLTKVCTVRAMVFPVVMYGCESWTVKKVECWRIHAFKLWCWKRLLWVPWTARRSNQSILKDINHEHSLKRLMLKLNILILWPRMWSWLIGKESDARKDWGQEEKEVTEDEVVGWHHWLNGCEFEQT